MKNMLNTLLLGFTPLPRFHLLLLSPNPKHSSISCLPSTSSSPSLTSKLNAKRSIVCASQGGNGNGIGATNDDRKEEKDRVPAKWLELLIDPDPNNILAVGLTGLLAWASVQVLWQLFFISFAILVAALKYSFIAAFLLFILVTLL